MEHPVEITPQAPHPSRLLTPIPAESRRPLQPNHDEPHEHPTFDIDELDESHLIRGYD